MTREEAIEVVKAYRDYSGWFKKDSDIYEAFEMAIQALSQEPCDDAISREWLMRKATERFYTTNYFNHISAMIEEAPPVTHKSGKWIETEYHRWRCSVCREKGVSEWDNIHAVRTNFCPDCGAKMESEE